MITKGEDEAVDLRLNDQVNKAYFLIYGLSSFLSPIIGSFIYTQFQMRKSFDIVATINVLFAVVLYAYNCGPDAVEENARFVQKLKNLKKEQEQEWL